jgi:hypothetical protein
MSIPYIDQVAVPMLAIAGTYAVLHFFWRRRVIGLERDLQTCTEAICQMADTHMAAHKKMAGTIAELEQKLVELAAPARKTGIDLDKRHRVLRLARNGVAVDDISKRLKVPRGEAELILSLRKFAEMVPAESASKGDLKNHVQS